MLDCVELLFFDTFAHDGNTEEINLDLVQFPKPVYVTEVRIIPLGARVQADFPGGVRLGATNPSQFKIEFFVNDLGRPGVSTFETLGSFEYNQNGCINLECLEDSLNRRIPTDGLVLKGWYTTITLAVYGILTNNLPSVVEPVPTSNCDGSDLLISATVVQSSSPLDTNSDTNNDLTTGVELYNLSHTDAKRNIPYLQCPEVDDNIKNDTDELQEQHHLTKKQTKKNPIIIPNSSPTRLTDEVDTNTKSPVIENSLTTSIEEFEPILSDEDEILDDSDTDYDYTLYTNNDELLKKFIPGVTLLKEFPEDYFLHNEDTILLNLNDYFKSSIVQYSCENFRHLNTELKEEFVHLCEGLIPLLNTTLKQVKRQKLHLHNCLNTLIHWLDLSLNYDLANTQDQPAYKIRHIKCGVRLANACSYNSEFVQHLYNTSGVHIPESLFKLYQQENMALSIRLMIVNALDSYLQHRSGIEVFLQLNFNQNNGYKMLINLLHHNPLVRLKFALQSVIRKLNFYEVLLHFERYILQLQTGELPEYHIDMIVKILMYLNETENQQFLLTQPARFLPVSSQFQITQKAFLHNEIVLHFFEEFHLLELLLILVTNSSTMNISRIKCEIVKLIENVYLNNENGLKYLRQHIHCVNLLIKTFINDEDWYIQQNFCLKLAYKMQTYWYIMQLMGNGPNANCESSEIIDLLHGMYCVTLEQIGKVACGKTLGLGRNFEALTQFFNSPEKVEALRFGKSQIGLAYIIDLTHLTCVTLNNVVVTNYYRKELIQLSNLAVTDPDQEEKLLEMKRYLMVPSYKYWHHIQDVIEIIETNLNRTQLPYSGEICAGLRQIYWLVFDGNRDDEKFVQLKHKHVLLQLYSLDGQALLTRVLQKIIDYYQQPFLHVTQLVSMHCAFNLLDTIKICLDLLEKILKNVIDARNTDYRDLTTIPILLKIYNLLQVYQISSGPYLYQIAQECCRKIINILLVYTQPNFKVAPATIETEHLNRSLWSQMLGEVFKFVQYAPYTFIAGLLILTELLPIPLPIQYTINIPDCASHSSWLLKLRLLWSVHLYPHHNIIQTIITNLSTTIHQQLQEVLRKFCVQFCDLGANCAQLIVKILLDQLYFEDKMNGLPFFASMVISPAFKCTFLYLIHTDKRYSGIFNKLCCVLTSTTSSTSCIDSILNIFQNLCDCEIAMNPTRTVLLNSLPSKDDLSQIVTTIITFVETPNLLILLPILRMFLLLTEHNYGMMVLKEHLLRNRGVFFSLINQLTVNRDNINIPNLNAFIELITICRIRSNRRTQIINLTEFEIMLNWNANNTDHPLRRILKILDTDSFQRKQLSAFIDDLSNNTDDIHTDTDDRTQDCDLPEQESLQTQFCTRMVLTERLTIPNWQCSTEELDQNPSLIHVDLDEICRLCFVGNDYNLTKEIEKVCHLKIDQATDDATVLKCTEIKKPFVTPMRSNRSSTTFSRSVTQQQRPDLFRSRPPNTSRPPSLHVDDFVALETCGAQPTGPTGYNKFNHRDLIFGQSGSRLNRGTARGRSFTSTERSQYRQMAWWASGRGGPY